uniref:Liver-expressed antimicrobial peptide 2 n=1 Tax=Electrophorus electricus TaxID=8005 RepID=A0A4W4FFP4_ELEEL
MRHPSLNLLTLAVLTSLLCTAQVKAAPVLDSWSSGLIQRAKRSLLWRWNTLKPVGSGCRDHFECGTNYCRRNICTFQAEPSLLQ